MTAAASGGTARCSDMHNYMHKKENYDVIIAGAGLAGLSCACELVERGVRPLVLEAHPYAGGRTSSFYDNGMWVGSGLHRYIGYYSALPRLLRRCGVSIGDIVTWEEKADILIKGQNKKMVLGLAPLFAPIKTMRGLLGNRDVLSSKDKLSLIPFFVCGFASYLFSDVLDGYSVAEYADKHRVTDRAKRLILEPLSSGIFFLPPEEYSAYAFFGLFAPAIPKFYKMRIGAFLGGMSDVLCEPMVRKIRSYGGDVLFNEPVECVLTQRDAVVGVRAQSGEYWAGKTVIAADLNAAKKILSPLRNAPQLAKLFRLPCMSACTVQLELYHPALEKDITTFGPGTDMVSFAEQSRSTFRSSEGRLSVILGNAKKYADRPIEEIMPVVLSQMASLGVHLEDEVFEARKVCEKDEFYFLGKGSQCLRPRQHTGIKGLVLAGDYTLTRSFATMEGAVLSGKKAAKECLKP